MQSNRKNVVHHVCWRLHVKNSGFHRPCSEAADIQAFTYSNCQILVPKHLPVGASSLVEKDSSHREEMGPQNDFHNFPHGYRFGEQSDARDGQKISLRIQIVIKLLGKSLYGSLV